MTDAETPASSESPDTTRRNVLTVAGLVIVMALFGGLYLLYARDRVVEDIADREARAQAAIEAFESEPGRESFSSSGRPTPSAVPTPSGPAGPVPQSGEVLVVNRVPGDDYGRLAIRHQDGSRTLLERECLRVHVSSGHGVCLSQDPGVVPAYRTTFFDADDPFQTEFKDYASALPSRVRVSPDGSLMSVTAFVTGTSYEDISGETSTIVTIDEFQRGNQLRGANQFDVLAEGDKYENANAQFWGLTFANNDDFFITGFFDDTPEILSGSLADMTATPTGWVGSCPSVSPDAKTLIYKEKRDEGGFDLVAVDLDTNERWTLNETRSVDDQVEWLDDDTILYALHPEDGDQPVQPEFDIWMLDIAEGSEPVLFLPNADSPAVIR